LRLDSFKCVLILHLYIYYDRLHKNFFFFKHLINSILICICCCVSAGTVRVSVSAADVDVDEGSSAKRKSRPSSINVREKQLVKQLNVELLETTLIEVRNLRKVALSGHEPRSLDRRKTLLHSIRQLTRYRREITDVFEGSVIFCVRCRTVRALTDLWTLCRSGRLRDALRLDFVTDTLLAKYCLRNFDFVISFSEAEYQLCKKELLSGLSVDSVHTCIVGAVCLGK